MTSDLGHIRIAAIFAVVVAFGGHAVSQSALGHIRGTITDAQGGTFPVAFVEATRQPSGPTVNGTGGASEPYNIDVPAVENATGFTQMLLDGRPHPASVGPNWLGHSVGTWDGDTLVVDAIGFHDRGWLNFDGQPHSGKLHVTERIRRPDLGHLEIEITLDDPGAFRKTWTGTKYATLAPDVELQEYVCNENNKDVAHLVGK